MTATAAYSRRSTWFDDHTHTRLIRALRPPPCTGRGGRLGRSPARALGAPRNKIGDGGATALGEALAANQGLTTLDLGGECLPVLARLWTGCAHVYAAAVLVLGRGSGGLVGAGVGESV